MPHAKRRPFAPRPRTTTVRATWFEWYPRRGLNTLFWIEVGKIVRARRIRHADRARVVGVCREVDSRLVTRGVLDP